METVDILKIDNEIQTRIKNEYLRVSEYKETIKKLKAQMMTSNLSQTTVRMLNDTCVKLLEEINEIESNNRLNFYLVETTELINKYRDILNTPLKMNFVGKIITNNSEKQQIIQSYLDVVQKYSKHHSNANNMIIGKKEKIACNYCKNSKKFDTIENDIICMQCSSQQTMVTYQSSYRDSDRINISPKYEYDRKIHFRDCINQYQGKQNSTVEPCVYKDLEEQFKIHYLIEGGEITPKHLKFKRITKEHIM